MKTLYNAKDHHHNDCLFTFSMGQETFRVDGSHTNNPLNPNILDIKFCFYEIQTFSSIWPLSFERIDFQTIDPKGNSCCKVNLPSEIFTQEIIMMLIASCLHLVPLLRNIQNILFAGRICMVGVA